MSERDDFFCPDAEEPWQQWQQEMGADAHYREWIALTELKELTDMKVSEMIPSKFLRKEDFDDDQVVTIRGLKNEEVGKDGETRWVLYFRELAKGMVLNITSIRVLEGAYGDESDNWKGQPVTIYVDPNVQFQGKQVGGLRLRVNKPRADKPAKAAPAADADFNDDVPF